MAKYRIVLLSNLKYRVDTKYIYSWLFWDKGTFVFSLYDSTMKWIEEDIRKRREKREALESSKSRMVTVVRYVDS